MAPVLPQPGVRLLLRALFKRPTRDSRTPAGATYRLARLDAAHVRRYNAAFGFPGAAVPLTYLYLLAQRAQLATMLDGTIPFRIPGLIHVENLLTMHGPVPIDTPLTLTTTVALPPPAANGAVTCILHTRGFDGERLAFSCDSIYLVKRGSRSGRADTPSLTGKPLGQWTIARNAGRRYAALSGDWNPIHLWGWSARLMGMKQPIIHGAHTMATAAALLQNVHGREATSIWCRFRQPVPLGAGAALFANEDAFTVVCNGKVALEGRLVL